MAKKAAKKPAVKAGAKKTVKPPVKKVAAPARKNAAKPIPKKPIQKNKPSAVQKNKPKPVSKKAANNGKKAAPKAVPKGKYSKGKSNTKTQSNAKTQSNTQKLPNTAATKKAAAIKQQAKPQAKAVQTKPAKKQPSSAVKPMPRTAVAVPEQVTKAADQDPAETAEVRPDDPAANDPTADVKTAPKEEGADPSGQKLKQDVKPEAGAAKEQQVSEQKKQEELLKLEADGDLDTSAKADDSTKKDKAAQPGQDSRETLLESYTVRSDFVLAAVNISQVKGENVPIYDVKMPEITDETELLLQAIIDKLSKITKVSIEEVTDSHKMFELRAKFFDNALKEVEEYLPNLFELSQKALAGMIVQRMYGFGELDIIMADNFLEDVCINRSDHPICVYHKHYGWVKTTVYVQDEEQTYNYASMIGRKVGRDINSLNPIMDAHMVSGDRVAATLSPISSFGHTLSLRRFARSPWTVTHLISPKLGVMTKEMAALLWQALEYELNILVCGGTASGKTSVLNALCALMPKNQRILSIEDTREFSLPVDLNWNWVPMVSREENSEGYGKVSMLDLIIASLRMRPDRIIVGEVRTREQAETMFEAMHTGHSVYTTMHADTVEQMTRRLLEPPIQIPKNEAEALDIILVQHRDRQRNIRRTLEIAEILHGGSLNPELKVNYLYRWRPRTDDFERVEDSIRLVEELNLRTGMTVTEINNDLKKRGEILQWLLDNNVYDTNMIGKIMKVYYSNREKLMAHVRKKDMVMRVVADV